MKYILILLFLGGGYSGDNLIIYNDSWGKYHLGSFGLNTSQSLGRSGNGNKKHDREDRLERRETRIIWRLTEELELTTEQAEKFFPKHREHRKIIESLRDQILDLSEKNWDKINNQDVEEITYADITKVIKNHQDLRKKIIDIETEFIFKMEELLTPKQLAILATFKERMIREMKSELKDKKGNNRNRKNKRNRKMY